MTPSSKYLNSLVGRTVSVWSTGQQSTKDTGILDGFDGVVIRLRKEGSNDVFLFPIQTVRLIKGSETQ